MPSCSRLSSRFLMTALLLISCGLAQADVGARTDAAFAALLAMPGAQPKDGGWLIPEQDLPTPESETALIARLALLKKQGADFNAIRHRGSLLGHAIRAGKERTAIWLLAQGADTRQVTSDDPADALQLARKYQRSAVIRAIEGRPGFKTAPPAVETQKSPSSAPSAPRSDVLPALERLHGWAATADESTSRAAWQAFAATLGREDYAALFKDGANLRSLALLTIETEGGLEAAFARLPEASVRRGAGPVIELLLERSWVRFDEGLGHRYSGASLSWPALWRRIDQPLNYDRRPDLAAHVPPALWPALFASGYAQHDAEATQCQLGALSPAAFKAMWPDFRRLFQDAAERAPALVLYRYRRVQNHEPCETGSSPADTLAKLEFLRTQGASNRVADLDLDSLKESHVPEALARLAATYAPSEPAAPRLVQQVPDCVLRLDEPWLDLLIQRQSLSWGVPVTQVQIVELPGSASCGLLLSGDQFRYDGYGEPDDSFESGPFREGTRPRCGDSQDDSEVWSRQGHSVLPVKKAANLDRLGTNWRQVRDADTGKTYWINSGLTASQCSSRRELPSVYEWGREGAEPRLQRAVDQRLIKRMLSEQCQKSNGAEEFVCVGLDPETAAGEGQDPLDALRAGRPVAV